MNSPPENELFEICIIGDQATGKTAVFDQYADGLFFTDNPSTPCMSRVWMIIESPNLVTRLHLRDITHPKTFPLWDSRGHQRYEATTLKKFYHQTNGVFLICDITRPDFIFSIKRWNTSIVKHCGKEVPRIVLINKIDLLNQEEIEILCHTIDTLCHELGLSAWFKISCKENLGIHEAFETMLFMIRNHMTMKDPLQVLLEDNLHSHLKKITQDAGQQSETQLLKHRAEYIQDELKQFITSLEELD